MQKLWDDNYFNPAKKQLATNASDGNNGELPRCFVQFIMKPIIMLIRNVMDGQLDTVWKMLENLQITLNAEKRRSALRIYSSVSSRSGSTPLKLLLR